MKPLKGHLEILDQGFGFLRSLENNYSPGKNDVFVPAALIKSYNLPEGGYIEGSGKKQDDRNSNAQLQSVEAINHISPDSFSSFQSLQDQTSINPTEQLIMTQAADDFTGRTLDLITPIGKGQRGLIISPPKSGKTTILKHIAASIIANYPDVDVFVLLVDERPEEVTDFKRGLKGAHVLYSSADQSIDTHMRMTRLALHTAIHCAETGRDSVVMIDSLTRMSRAFNVNTQSYGRTMTGGLGAGALAIPRKIFGAARNVEDGGSLTIIATILVDTGSRMDDIIYQEFKGTGNSDIVLSRKCAEKRIWPAINLNASGTRREELLLDEETYQEATRIRGMLSSMEETTAMSTILEYFQQGVG
ncbi:MAG: transcription termination factor Rho [Desulfobacterales bacterium]|nr:transcription termination factor Rho [Desulfobacterales bacterium]MDX2513104.1 transcription termination factor Rho [Desulfobacterales bacterium]